MSLRRWNWWFCNKKGADDSAPKISINRFWIYSANLTTYEIFTLDKAFSSFVLFVSQGNANVLKLDAVTTVLVVPNVRLPPPITYTQE